MTWATDEEKNEHFRATTCERPPADKGDTRFEHGVSGTDEHDTTSRYLGNEEAPYWVESIDDTGTVYRVDFFATQAEVFDMIEAFRYSQGTTLEEEFAPFGPAWQREQEGRGR